MQYERGYMLMISSINTISHNGRLFNAAFLKALSQPVKGLMECIRVL